MTNQTPTEKEPISQTISQNMADYISVYNLLMYARACHVIDGLIVFEPYSENILDYQELRELDADYSDHYKYINYPNDLTFNNEEFKQGLNDLYDLADHYFKDWKTKIKTYTYKKGIVDLFVEMPPPNQLADIFEKVKETSELIKNNLFMFLNGYARDHLEIPITLNELHNVYIPIEVAVKIFHYRFTRDIQADYLSKRWDNFLANSTIQQNEPTIEGLLQEIGMLKNVINKKNNEIKRLNKNIEIIRKHNPEKNTELAKIEINKIFKQNQPNSRNGTAITRENSHLRLTVYGLKLVLDDINNGKDFKHLFPRGVTNNAIATNIENCFHKKAKLEKAIKLNAPNKDTVTKQIKKGEGVYKSDYTSLDDYNAEQIIEGSVTACNS